MPACISLSVACCSLFPLIRKELLASASPSAALQSLSFFLDLLFAPTGDDGPLPRRDDDDDDDKDVPSFTSSSSSSPSSSSSLFSSSSSSSFSLFLSYAHHFPRRREWTLMHLIALTFASVPHSQVSWVMSEGMKKGFLKESKRKGEENLF